jgi:hypothetical protein
MQTEYEEKMEQFMRDEQKYASLQEQVTAQRKKMKKVTSSNLSLSDLMFLFFSCAAL